MTAALLYHLARQGHWKTVSGICEPLCVPIFWTWRSALARQLMRGKAER